MSEPIPRVIAGLLRVLNGEGAAKHGMYGFLERDDREDMVHALVHEHRADDPELADYDEAGDLHELKALCRRALKLERRMVRDD